MDKFLHQIKDLLEDQTPPDFEPNDWADMQKRLENQKSTPKQIGAYWPWLAVSLFLCSLGFNGFLYNEFQKINNKITNLDSRKDSVIYTKVTYQTDTIYMVGNSYTVTNKESSFTALNVIHSPVNTDNTVYQPSTLFSKNTPFIPLFSKNHTRWNNLTRRDNFSLSSDFWLSTANQSTLLQQKQAAEVAEKEMHLNPVSALAAIPISELVGPEYILPNLLALITEENKKKSLRQRIYPLRPKGIAAGANIGTGITLSKNYNDFHILDRGVLVKVKFSNTLKLRTALNFSTISYGASDMGDQYGVPVITYSNDDAELEEIQVNRKIWSASAGMEYSFRTHRKWQPFIGIDLGASTFTKNSVDYIFEDEITDEYFSEIRNYAKEKNLSYTRLNTGLTYAINKKWILQLHVDYLYRLQKLNNQLPHNLNLGLNGLYNF